MKRAIVFDLDGTLVDSAPDIHAAVNGMLLEEGHSPLSLAVVLGFVGHGLQALVAQVIEYVGLSMAEHERLSARVLNLYERDTARLTSVYPGVLGALKQFSQAGWRIGLCTNKPLKPTQTVLKSKGLLPFFDAIIGGDSLHVRKPDPAPLLSIITQLQAETALFVGDSEVDYATAQAAQVPFLLYSAGYRKSDLDFFTNARVFSKFDRLYDLADHDPISA